MISYFRLKITLNCKSTATEGYRKIVRFKLNPYLIYVTDKESFLESLE
jgi:hypothetical protein